MPILNFEERNSAIGKVLSGKSATDTAIHFNTPAEKKLHQNLQTYRNQKMKTEIGFPLKVFTEQRMKTFFQNDFEKSICDATLNVC